MNPKVYPLIGIFVAFVYEHVARLNGLWRMAVPLAWMAERAKDFCFELGRLLARLSSYLNYIDFDEVMITLDSLVHPIWNLCVSPLEMLVGYAQTAWEYAHPSWVYWGSGVLIVATYALWYRFRGHPVWIARIRARWNANHYFVGQAEQDVEPVDVIVGPRRRRGVQE
jgi:hypothetical protein